MSLTRIATQDDITQLAQLFDDYRVWYRKATDLQGANAFLSERIAKEESIIYVTEVGGELTGFTQLYPLFSSTRMQRMWLLNDLFVAPNWRGKGHSKALIEAAKGLAKATNACGVQLETELTNDIGNQLYPATGFDLNTETQFYFWTNKD